MTARSDPGPVTKKALTPSFFVALFWGALLCPLYYACVERNFEIAFTLIWVEAGMITLWIALLCGWPKPKPPQAYIVECPNCQAELSVTSSPDGPIVKKRGL
jgi:hypothetical protein